MNCLWDVCVEVNRAFDTTSSDYDGISAWLAVAYRGFPSTARPGTALSGGRKYFRLRHVVGNDLEPVHPVLHLAIDPSPQTAIFRERGSGGRTLASEEFYNYQRVPHPEHQDVSTLITNSCVDALVMAVSLAVLVGLAATSVLASPLAVEAPFDWQKTNYV